ncbi:HEPN domain-containing protein [Paenibacillus sp. LMG 31459]|uniref:HEPN domain-containing protein n=1 Tax=Paenibacillus phytohabitans TaxID=2654978 RepID=A0ABX1YIJ2_9BACL|nr:HEPN domain-containing protein [Paenibacillus phytohabitans]NOU79971.1 HEPN domain-containing protein [Paenibacillus phytohabitans]
MGRSMQEKINDYTELAQYHIKLAHIMRNHKQYKTAFFLCHSALNSMIRALYIYEHKTEFGTEISLSDLLLLIHPDYNPGLEIVVFVSELNFIVNGEGKELEVIQDEDMKRVMRRAAEVLEELCWRMGI